MIIVLGYRTPSASEVPEVIYLGDDGDEANRAIESARFPRIGRLDNPIVRPVRHYDEDAAAEFNEAPKAKAKRGA